MLDPTRSLALAQTPIDTDSASASMSSVSLSLLRSVEFSARAATLTLAQIDDTRANLLALLELSTGLSERANQTSPEPTPERIWQAWKKGESVDALFASDRRSLGANLDEANRFASILAYNGIALDGSMRYPVIVTISEGDSTTESLVWMTASERSGLDAYAPASQPDLPGGAVRVRANGDQTIRYVCLDSQANRRIDPSGLQETLAKVGRAAGREREAVERQHAAFCAELRACKASLNHIEKLLAASGNDTRKRQEKKREQALSDEEANVRLWQEHKASLEKLSRTRERKRISADQLKGSKDVSDI
jgi:hypothetical protein